MANVGALFVAVRSGGSGAIGAARQLQALAQAGQLSEPQVQQLNAAEASPELRDVFAAAVQNFDSLTGHSARAPDVSQLTRGLEHLGDASELPGRFFTDANVFRAELSAGQTDHAGRLLQFFEPYAEKFVDARPTLDDAQATKLETQFSRALTQLGFSELRTNDGRTALEAARDMLRASDPAGVRAARPEPAIVPQLRIQPQPARIEEPPDSKPGEQKKKPRDGVLGSRMVWNVMHLLRGEELDDVAKKDAMNQLMISAVLLLVLGGVVAMVLLIAR